MSDIIVRFTPKGHKDLQTAIKTLSQLTGKYNKELKEVKKRSDRAQGPLMRLAGTFGLLTTRTQRNSQAFGILSLRLSTIRSKLLLLSFGAGLATGAFTFFTTRVVGAAARTEELQKRLSSLYGSLIKGETVFANFTNVAATTPFAIDRIVEAGTQLKAFGLDAEQAIKPTADLAAFMGTDVVDAAQAMGRAFAGGVGAADVLRERGILNLIKEFKGIDDLTKLTLPQFRQAMIETFIDPSAGIAGATTQLALTFSGSLSNMQDALFQTSSALGGFLLGPSGETLREITDKLNQATEHLRDMSETPLETVVRKMKQLGINTREYDIALLNIQHNELKRTLNFPKMENHIDQITKKEILLGKELQNEANLITDIEDRYSTHFAKHNVDLKQAITLYKDFLKIDKSFDSISDFLSALPKATVALFEEMFGDPKSIFQFPTEFMDDLDELFSKQQDIKTLSNDIKLFEADVTTLAQMKILMAEILQLQTNIGTTVQAQIVMDLPETQEDILRKSLTRNQKLLGELKTQADSAAKAGNYTDAIIAADAYAQQLGVVISQEQKLLNIEEAKIKSFGRLAGALGNLAGSTGKNTKEQARLAQAAAIIDTYAGANKAFKQGGTLGFVTGAAIIAQGLANVAKIETQLNNMGAGSNGGGGVYGKFEHGGYVGGRPHSQGGTIIEAERGEFVMSRNAVESIGLETLNQMNQSGGGGSINVSVTGNVLTQDFVEGELAESIKEAVRRGSDFGIG
jgi:hypothetical protein